MFCLPISVPSPLIGIFFVTTRLTVFVLLSNLGFLCYCYFSLIETLSFVALLLVLPFFIILLLC